MRFHRVTIVCLAFAAAGCSPAPPVAPSHSAMAMGAAVVTPLGRSATTISNQPLKLPQGAAEMVAAAVDIPPGGATSIHQHPWSRFVYVERGVLRVINYDTGESREFAAGSVLPEVIAQWHEGRAVGPAPLRLIVLDLVPPGATNMIVRQ